MIIVRYSGRMRSFGDDLQRFRGMRVGVEFGQVEQVCAHGENERTKSGTTTFSARRLRDTFIDQGSAIVTFLVPRASTTIPSTLAFTFFPSMSWKICESSCSFHPRILRRFFELDSLSTVYHRYRWEKSAGFLWPNRRRIVETVSNPFEILFLPRGGGPREHERTVAALLVGGSLVGRRVALSKPRASSSHLDRECWTRGNLGRRTDTPRVRKARAHQHSLRRDRMESETPCCCILESFREGVLRISRRWVRIGKIFEREYRWSLKRFSF